MPAKKKWRPHEGEAWAKDWWDRVNRDRAKRKKRDEKYGSNKRRH